MFVQNKHQRGNSPELNDNIDCMKSMTILISHSRAFKSSRHFIDCTLNFLRLQVSMGTESFRCLLKKHKQLILLSFKVKDIRLFSMSLL